MRVLIVEDDPALGRVWGDHIERLGADVHNVSGQTEAIEALQDQAYDMLILNLELSEGSPMAVADYASYRRPDAKAIFVTSRSFFSDGSIFHYMANACAMVQHASPPEDIAALVDYHCR